MDDHLLKNVVKFENTDCYDNIEHANDSLNNIINNKDNNCLNFKSATKYENKISHNYSASEFNTLPCALISIMQWNKRPMSEIELITYISNKLNDLRKPDGSKYKNNINKVLKSTLCSSGIFEKVDGDLWYFKEEEAFHYVMRNKEKLKVTENQLQTSHEHNSNTTSNLLSSKKQRKSNIMKKSLKDYNLKYNTAVNILDELLNKYKNNKEVYKNFKSPFTNCSSWEDLIKKVNGDTNKIIGIISVYKFFKPLITKILKLQTIKKKQKPGVKNLNEHLINVENKIQMIHEMFAQYNNIESVIQNSNTD